VGVAALLGSVTVSAHAITIDWVTVGDPGNAADTAPAGRGAVATSFQIMKYECERRLKSAARGGRKVQRWGWVESTLG
jgi:hypothetical protein